MPHSRGSHEACSDDDSPRTVQSMLIAKCKPVLAGRNCFARARPMIALISGCFSLSTSFGSNLVPSGFHFRLGSVERSTISHQQHLCSSRLVPVWRVARMPLRLELSLFSLVLLAIGNTVRGGPAAEISWRAALFKTEAILRKDCGDKCVEVARQPVVASSCKCLSIPRCCSTCWQRQSCTMQQLCVTCGNPYVLESRGVYAIRKARVSVHCTFSAIVCFSRFARSTEQAFLHMWLCTCSFDIRKASYVERMRDSLLNSKAAQRNGLEGRMRQPMALRTKTMMAGGLSNYSLVVFAGLRIAMHARYTM